MIETLALAGAERIDRQAAERWFDLRATAAQSVATPYGRGMVWPCADDQRRGADGPLAGSPGTS